MTLQAVGPRPHALADRAPTPLLPVAAARAVGFAALACLGVWQWQRMVAATSLSRPLLWVALALLIAALVVICERAPDRLRRVARVGVAATGLLGAYVAAGLDLTLLKPARLYELGSGLVNGGQALGTVALPYEGADPWPARVLNLLGAALVLSSSLLRFWPRRQATRGWSFLAIVPLLVLTAAPVVALGGARPLLLGAVLTLLTVCFLWLERLPLRPGLGVATLVGLALAGALPLAAAADRGQPWLDYQALAEGLSPKDPVRFDWEHGDYGPIRWTRTGAEVLRVKAARPAYWKARTLDDFDGRAWESGRFGSADPSLELAPGWQRHTQVIQVSIRRLRGRDVVAAGTTLDISGETRSIASAGASGQWRSSTELRSGDSYRARVVVPRPTPDQLASVRGSSSTPHADELRITADLRDLAPDQLDSLPADMPTDAVSGRPPENATIHFPPFGRGEAGPVADYRAFGVQGDGASALGISNLSRTWRLAEDLRAESATPYEYVQAISAYLRRGFSYTERPPAPARGVTPLESFLFDSKAGYCQQFSAAMALLLRMGGVPARVATGFSPGGYSKRAQAWIVRDTDAHSWVEAWFDGYGWVTLDPTPSATPARSQIAAIAAPPGAGDGDTGLSQGGDGEAAPTDRRAAGERERLFGAGGTTDEELGPAGARRRLGVLAGLAGLAGLAVAATTALVIRRRRLPDDPHERALVELWAALRASGRKPEAGMTLRQLEQRLGLSLQAAGYLRAITACRYATRAALPSDSQRQALRRELAVGLGVIGRVRTMWALPPRIRRRRTGC